MRHALHAVLVMLLLAWPAALYAQTSQLLITVADDEDRPLPGARVVITDEDTGNVVASGTTDALGGLTANVRSGRQYFIDAALEGYVTPVGRGHTMAPPGKVLLRYTLARFEPQPEIDSPPPPPRPVTGIITGRVLSRGSQQPVAGVKVTASGGDSRYPVPPAITAADGSFRLIAVPGSYHVYAEGRFPGALTKPTLRSFVAYTSAEFGGPVPVASRHVTGPVEMELTPIPLFRVSATVVDASGQPVPDADVEITGRSFDAYAGTTNAFTRMDGTVVAGWFRGRVILTARAGDDREFAATTSIDVQNAPVDDVRLVLAPAARLRGRIETLDGQVPLQSPDGFRVLTGAPEVTVSRWSSGDPGLMQADGTFTVTGLVGERRIMVGGLPYEWHMVSVHYQGRDITNVPLLFQPGDEISDVVIVVAPWSTAPRSPAR